MKYGRLRVPLQSKLPGYDKRSMHRVGTRCQLQRHASDPGLWVLFFGKQYAIVPAVALPDTVDLEK